MNAKIHWITGLAALSMLLTGYGWAGDTPLTYQRINLSVSTSRDVETDTLVAVLYSQKEDSSAERAAAEVNKAMQKAMVAVRKHPVVSHQTQAYSTTPIYSKPSLVSGATVKGWRARQSMRLESQDFTAMSQLIGQLQQNLALERIDYSISAKKRRHAEKDLISEAIGRFRQRAELVADAWGEQDYRPVEMSINTNGITPRPFRAQTMSLEMKTATPPALEAGKQRLEVRVSGTIELK